MSTPEERAAERCANQHPMDFAEIIREEYAPTIAAAKALKEYVRDYMPLSTSPWHERAQHLIAKAKEAGI